MSSKDFNSLSLSDKIKLLYTEGDFVTAIRYYGYKINLYLLFGYYVEVFYNHKEDRIEKAEPTTFSTKRVKFYTDQIKLPAGI